MYYSISAPDAVAANLTSPSLPRGNAPANYPVFELGEHPSEIMARKAVWRWVRSFWIGAIRRRMS